MDERQLYWGWYRKERSACIVSYLVYSVSYFPTLQILDVTGNALWMDGGNRITSVESLLTVFDKYENQLGGFYCPGHSGGVVKDWTHPDEVRMQSLPLVVPLF
jgi:hypothetical protein